MINYQIDAIGLDGVRAEESKESLQTDTQQELTHAEQLGQRLKQLDARPPGSTDVLAVINDVVKSEEDAIATYRSLIEIAEEASGPVTEDLAVTILANREAHRTEFQGFEEWH